MPFQKTATFNPVCAVIIQEVEEISGNIPTLSVANETSDTIVLSFAAAGVAPTTTEVAPGTTFEKPSGPKHTSGGPAPSGTFTASQKDGAVILQLLVENFEEPYKHATRITVKN